MKKSKTIIYRLCGLMIAIILSISSMASTETEVSGLPVKILDRETKQPLISATIATKDKSWAVVTDLDGIANIKGIALDEKLFVSYVGYRTLEITLQEIIDNGKVIYLSQVAFDLGGVVISSTPRATVRREDIAVQVEVIKQSEINVLNPQNSADVLQAGGVFIQKSQMGGGSPIIRGFEANKVLIVIDGVRLNNAIYRNGHLQNVITIDNAILDRTEIIQGPSSVIYGSDALGGVMHFFTRDPKLNFNKRLDHVTMGNAYVRYSSANKEKAVHFDFNYGEKKWASLSSVTYSEFGDLRMGSNRSSVYDDYPDYGYRTYYTAQRNGIDTVMRNPDPLRQIGTGYNQMDLLQKFRFQPTDDLNFVLNVQYSTTSNVPRYDQISNDYEEEMVDGDTIRSFRFAEWDYGPQDRFFASLRSRITKENILFNEASIIASVQKVDEDRIKRRFGRTFREYQEEDVYVGALNIDFVKVFNEGRHQKLLYGAELTYNKVFSDAYDEDIFDGTIDPDGITRYPNGGSDMTNMAVYANYRQKFMDDKLSVMAGARYSYSTLNSLFNSTTSVQLPFDSISINNSRVTGSVSVAWNAIGNWYFDAVLATAFRSPNVDDFGKIRAKNGFVTVPNADLTSEKSINGEISVSNKISKQWRVSATYYYTHLYDAIIRDNYSIALDNGTVIDSIFIDGEWNKTQANVNGGTAYITGVSANAMWTPIKNLQMKGSLNYVKGWSVTESRPLEHIPPMYGQISATYIQEKFELRGVGRFNARKSLDNYGPDGSSDNLEYALPTGTPSWWILNAYAAYNISPKFSVNIGVENILDTYYRPFSSGVSAPGRNVIVSLRGNF